MRNQKSAEPRPESQQSDQSVRGRGEPRRGRSREAEAGHNALHPAGQAKPEQQAGAPRHRGIAGNIDKNP
jgi:hypothetical protein